MPRRGLNKSTFLHCVPHSAFAHGNAILRQCQSDTFDSIIIVIRMLRVNLFDFDQKQLPVLSCTCMRKDAIVPGFTDFKNTAHCADAVFLSTQSYVLIQPFQFYRFRSLTKKPRASLKISLAFRSSAISFINWRSFPFKGASRRIPLPTKA
jgi:hypothetical protein